MLWNNALLQHRFNTYASSLSSHYSLLFSALLVPPSIRAGPRAMKVQVGHAIDLPCVAQGVPKPSVSWLKDGSALLDGSRYRISDEALTLNQVGLIDEGVYTCMASNIAGQDEANIQLHVQGQMDAGIYNCDYSYSGFKWTKNPMYCPPSFHSPSRGGGLWAPFQQSLTGESGKPADRLPLSCQRWTCIWIIRNHRSFNLCSENWPL